MTKHIAKAQPITLYILKSSTPNTFNMTRLVYNDTTIIKSIRKYRSNVFFAIRLLLSDV